MCLHFELWTWSLTCPRFEALLLASLVILKIIKSIVRIKGIALMNIMWFGYTHFRFTLYTLYTKTKVIRYFSHTAQMLHISLVPPSRINAQLILYYHLSTIWATAGTNYVINSICPVIMLPNTHDTLWFHWESTYFLCRPSKGRFSFFYRLALLPAIKTSHINL